MSTESRSRPAESRRPRRSLGGSRAAVQRFRATIRAQGINPYVDVPAAVSRAFARFAKAGRIAYAGTLNRAEIRGTLVPVGSGGHRLFVNGGMRSAAGVGVGDTVTFAIRATKPGAVTAPADVNAALRKKPRAWDTFAALSPSHRREWLRYVDDARTPENRERRIARMIGEVLGERAKPGRRGDDRPLWTCPRCGNSFVNRNQYHSCERHDLAGLFTGKEPFVRELFDRFRRMVEKCGPMTMLPYRDKIGFMVRVRFAGAVPRRRWLDVGFWLPRRVEHPRFWKVETLSPGAHIHLTRITEPGQLDAQLARWLEEAYAVGRQEHLKG